MRLRFAPPFSACLIAVVLVALTALPATAGNAYGHARAGKPAKHVVGADCGPVVAAPLQILHGPVTITLANPDSDGHEVGDLRATSIPTTDAAGAPVGHLDATLTTTAIDVPAQGDEIRISTLVFSFGDSGVDQVVVGGSAAYPAQGPTLAEGSVTTRPIQGGSGRYTGALGWAVSEHFPDGSWRHTLHLTRPVASGAFATYPLAVMPSVGIPHPFADDRTRPFRGRGMPDRFDRGGDPSPFHELLRALWSRLHLLDPGDVERGAVRRLDRGRSHRAERLPARFAEACLAPAPVPVAPAVEAPVYEGLQGSPIDEPGITREDLGRTLPAAAPGEELGLWHYTIPVGAELPPHTHPGAQIARVIRGALSYTVISGEGAIISSDGASMPIGSGTYTLYAGDSVVENPGMEHFGSNPGPEVVELIAATLYTEGAPLSIPVESVAPEASAAPAASASP